MGGDEGGAGGAGVTPNALPSRLGAFCILD